MNKIFSLFEKVIISNKKRIIFNKKYISITEGHSERILATSKQELIWDSDNENIAKVDKNGVITACSFSKWEPNNFYNIKQVIIHNDKLFECISPGKSGNIEPVWISGNNKVKIDGVIYNCIKSHTSSLDNKPGFGKFWKDFWGIYPHHHAWARDWRPNLSFSKEPIIEDGRSVRWVHRFKTVNIRATTKDGKFTEICEVTVVPWIASKSYFEIVSTSSRLANIAIKNKNWDFFYSARTISNIRNKFLKLLERLFISSRLRLLAIENKNDENIFYAGGATKIANCKLYKLTGSINAKPELIYEFSQIPERMLITPFGYFIILGQSNNGSDARTIYRSENLSNWNLEYTFNRRNNYVLWQGWDFDYDEDTKIGNIYIAEKYNPFPTKTAIITKATYKSNQNGSFIQVNEDGSQITEGEKSWHTAYEIPLVSDQVMVNNESNKIIYSCIQTHIADKSNKPGVGHNWQDFWIIAGKSSIKKWLKGKLYLSVKDRGKVRHLHNLQKDPFSKNIWLSTGDEDSESNIFYHSNKLLPDKKTGIVNLNLVGSGSQEWRTCGFVFTKKFIYWGMDAQVDKQHIFRIHRSKNERYISKSRVNYPKEDLGAFSDKPFFSSLGILHMGSNVALLTTGNEISQYNIDNRARVFAVKERKDGSPEIQEVLSAPAGIGSFGRFIPIFQDTDGYVYFALRNLYIFPHHQFFKTQLHWIDNDMGM